MFMQFQVTNNGKKYNITCRLVLLLIISKSSNKTIIIIDLLYCIQLALAPWKKNFY